MKIATGLSQVMALSAGPSWASIPRTSLSLQKHAQPIFWRSIEGCNFNLWKNVQGTDTCIRIRAFPISGGIFSMYEAVYPSESASGNRWGPIDVNGKLIRRKLVAFTFSGSQPPFDELTDDMNGINGVNDTDELDVIDDMNEVDPLKGNSHLSSIENDGEEDSVSPARIANDSMDDIKVASPRKEPSNIFWFLGPTVLVASLVFPSFYLRRILLNIFEDSLFTDFLILFFTEALFYGGVAIYVLLIDQVYQNQDPGTSTGYGQIKSNFGLRVLFVAMLVLSLIIPLVTMGMVWPWTGPAASATLAPYLVGIVVQFAFEQYARYKRSTACAIIPVVFQVYRLHQLNRATQLVTALSYSVRGVETTAQTVAINNSLGTLLNVLQLLGVICIWSLSSFLMRFLPASTAVPEP